MTPVIQTPVNLRLHHLQRQGQPDSEPDDDGPARCSPRATEQLAAGGTESHGARLRWPSPIVREARAPPCAVRS